MVKKDMTMKILITAIALLFVDQVIKTIVSIQQPIIDLAVVTIRYITNTGASFGMLQGNNQAFIWISLIVLGIFMISYDKFSGKSMNWVYLLSAGILSNLVDRIFRGSVVDYIDLGWWPVFNIADSLIVIGVIGLIIQLFREERQDTKPRFTT